MNPAKNLFLIGPMGAGKSSVGRRLAHRFGLDFVDLDAAIETQTGARIALIFELEGEVGFRRRERDALAGFAARDGIVLACGGGVVLDAANREILARQGFVVWLDVTVDQQLARLQRDVDRPLLATDDRRATLATLALVRNPLYAETADLRVDAGGVGLAAAVGRIAARITAAWTQEQPA